MPITPTSEYGLDYGAAPLDVAAAKAAGVRKGMPLSDETLAVASGVGVPTGAVTNPQPISAPASPMPLAGTDPFDNPYFKAQGYRAVNPKTAQDVVAGFVGAGMPLGAALNQYSNMKTKGLIPDLPGSAEVESNIPGFGESLISEAARSTAKPLAWVGSWLPGDLGAYFTDLGNKLESESEAMPPGWGKLAGDVAGYALNAELMEPLASAAAGQIAPRLPFLAKGLSAVDRIDQGLGIAGEDVSNLAPAVARLKKWQEGIQLGLKYGMTDVARGQSPISSLAFPLGLEGLRFLGKMAGIGQSAAKLTIKNGEALDSAYEFLASKAGVGVPELKGQVWNTEQLLQGLRDAGAPDHVVQKIYNAGTAGEFGDNWAQFVGNHAAEQRWDPAELKQFVAAAGGKYQDATLAAYDDALGGLRGTAEDIQPKAPPVGRFNVIDRPVERGGVDAYMHPMSQWAQTSNLLNEAMAGPGSRAIVKEFENPLEVVYKAGEHPAEAMFRQSTGPLANEVVTLANRAAGAFATDTKAYNDVLYNLAAKLATNGGYKSIRFLGPNPAEDIVLDLARFNPKADLGELSGIIQNRIRNAASTLFNGIPSYWLPIVGGSAILGATAQPPESQGSMVNWEVFKEILAGLGEDTSATPLLNELSKRGETTSLFALHHVADYTPIFGANELVNKLQELTDTFKANPKAPLETKVDLTPGWLDTEDKHVTATVMHPDIPRVPVAVVDGVLRPGGVFDPHSISGFAPGLVGPAQTRGILRQINDAVGGVITRVEDKGRVTGVAQAIGQGPRTVNFNYRAMLPPIAVGLGLGSLAGQEKAHASLLPPEAVEEFLSEGLETGFPKLVEASKPTAQVVKMLQMNAPAVTHEDLVNAYEDLHDDLKTGNQLTVSNLGTEPGGSFGVSHPATDPWYIATLYGSIDPDSGTWYADLAQTKQFGFGQDALKKIFGQVKALNPDIVKLGGKYAGLAGIAAALYGTYDYFAPAKAQAVEIPIGPLEELFSKGSPEISDYLNAAVHNKTVEDYINQTQEQMQTSAKINSGQVFDTEGEKLFANGPQSGPTHPAARDALGSMSSASKLNGAPSWRPMFDQSDSPAWQLNSGQFTRSRDALITAKNSVQNQLLRQIFEEILPRNGVDITNAGDMADFFWAGNGFKMGPDGLVSQTETGVAENILKAAEEYRGQINDLGFKVSKGVDLQAHAIAAKYGLDYTDPEMWKRMRFLQTDFEQSDPNRNMFPDGSRPKQSEIAAATEMQGHLVFDGPETHHDLNVQYGDGIFGFDPVAQQQATLRGQLEQLHTLYPNGLPQDVQAKAAIMEKYLGDLDEIARQNLVRRAPKMEVLASKQFFRPFTAPKGVTVPPELAESLRETSPAKVIENHVSGMMNKLYWDKQLFVGNKLAQMYEHGFPVSWDGGGAVIDQNGALADQIKENLNVYRGLRSIKEYSSAATLASSISRLFGGPEITPAQVQKFLGGWMNWQYITKLGGLRYPLIASTHPLLTAMAAGPEHLFPGYAAVMNDYEGAVKEAEAQFVLPTRGGFLQELSGVSGMGKANQAARFMSWLPEKAQNFNRLVAFQTGKHWATDMIAKTGEFTPPSWLKFFDESLLDGKHSVSDVIQGAAAAFTRTTQFVFSPEGRSLGFTGGPLRQLVGQFKGFSTNYGIFMKNLFLHGKATGEWRPFVNAVTSLAVVGGGTSAAALAPTALIGVNLYDLMRTELIKHGIVLPQGSLLGALGNWALAGAGADPAGPLSQAFNAVQLGGHLDPFHLPTDPAHVPSYVLGPTLGGLSDLLVSGGKVLLGKQPGMEFGKDVATAALGPLANTIPEAAQEAGLFGDFFSRIGYRGGMYSPTGKALANQPGPISVLARMVNLQPGIRQQRYQQVQDIGHAMEGGQAATANQLVDEAHAAGYIVDKKELAALKGQIKANQSKTLKANVGP